ncbi:DUF2812 domain-containing protein [Vallitalea okinawensis]|uniref:DUF2812 domain-containing protein n=1 Tax=Vallitalea okinawensis TaxID=2078660 RepID=UPI000CFD8215|nr:DUF2812 domain-containing protein [Vallitalea okinawensis]
MIHVIRKVFLDYEKEEKWLNELAVKGINFVDYSFTRYLFKEGQSGEYIYRIELLENLPSHPESKAYLKFLKESGVECMSTWYRWVYLRKKADSGPFDIYSDYEMRIKHHKRIVSLQGIGGVVNLLCAIINLLLPLTHHTSEPTMNLVVGIINLLIGMKLTSMAMGQMKRIYHMKKEKQLYE